MPLPGKGLTIWMVQTVAANKLRLYPAADDEAPTKSPRSSVSKGKKLLLVLAIGLVVGLLTKGYFYATRSYRAEARIVIEGVSEKKREAVLQRHLLAIQSGELIVSPDQTVSLRSVMEGGRASVFAFDPQTISVLIVDADRQGACDLARRFAQVYVETVANQNAMLNRKLSETQAKLLRDYRQYQQERSALKNRITDLVRKLPEKDMDTYLTRMTSTLETRIDESNALLAAMNQINADIAHYRGEIVHPTITLDEQRLNQMKSADRRYSGDYGLLQGKHAMYVANVKPEMQGLTDALETVRTHLRAMARSITKQLQMKLPDTLSDDLLEMSLAVEKYEGQLARFQERWTRYGEKLLAMLARPESADFEGVQTLLSQLRQDLMQRCSPMPGHLDGLYQQLAKGRSDKRRRGKLSSLTARNVAASAITGDLAQSLEGWRKLEYHLNRLFPDGNVHLLTLGRICRSLQGRLRFRDGQLRRDLETQMIAARKREARVQLNVLQRQFEQTSQALVGVFKVFTDDQRQIAETTERWPSWQKATESLSRLDDQMASLERKLNRSANGEFQPETLRLLSVVDQRFSQAGFSPRGENWVTLLLSLAGAILAMGIVLPSALIKK